MHPLSLGSIACGPRSSMGIYNLPSASHEIESLKGTKGCRWGLVLLCGGDGALDGAPRRLAWLVALYEPMREPHVSKPLWDQLTVKTKLTVSPGETDKLGRANDAPSATRNIF